MTQTLLALDGKTGSLLQKSRTSNLSRLHLPACPTRSCTHCHSCACCSVICPLKCYSAILLLSHVRGWGKTHPQITSKQLSAESVFEHLTCQRKRVNTGSPRKACSSSRPLLCSPRTLSFLHSYFQNPHGRLSTEHPEYRMGKCPLGHTPIWCLCSGQRKWTRA